MKTPLLSFLTILLVWEDDGAPVSISTVGRGSILTPEYVAAGWSYHGVPASARPCLRCATPLRAWRALFKQSSDYGRGLILFIAVTAIPKPLLEICIVHIHLDQLAPFETSQVRVVIREYRLQGLASLQKLNEEAVKRPKKSKEVLLPEQKILVYSALNHHSQDPTQLLFSHWQWNLEASFLAWSVLHYARTFDLGYKFNFLLLGRSTMHSIWLCRILHNLQPSLFACTIFALQSSCTRMKNFASSWSGKSVKRGEHELGVTHSDDSTKYSLSFEDAHT